MSTLAFPPLTPVVHFLSEIKYKELAQKFITILITTVAIIHAVSVFIYKNVSQWYQNGGKETIQKVYKKGKNFLGIVVLWLRIEVAPGVVSLYRFTRKQLIILGVLMPV